MFSELFPEDLARVLPGSWGVRATNFPQWLDTATHSQAITFSVITDQPLTLREVVCYGITGGEAVQLESIDRWRGDHFARRSVKKTDVRSSKWSVSGIGVDENSLVIRFAASRAVVAGLTVLVRHDTTAGSKTRALVAHNTEQFGLTNEDFASLGWLGGPH
jgi:hypothetical protein